MLRKSIPNFVTLMNLYCGVLAIINSFDLNIKNSALCIVIAMILDGMDGRIARLLKVEGEMGKELDSLADLVTFGVAPILMLYTVILKDVGTPGLLLTGIFPICGAYRLAKFNTTTHKVPNYFIGLPITAAGGILALFTMNYAKFSIEWFYVLVISLSILMVSNIKIPNFKKVKIPRHVYIFTPLMAIIIYFIAKELPNHFPYLLFVPIIVFIAYIFYSIKKKRKKRQDEKEDKDVLNL